MQPSAGPCTACGPIGSAPHTGSQVLIRTTHEKKRRDRLIALHVEVERWRADELEVRHGLRSELDAMGSDVGSKAHPRWLWHAIDHHTGQVFAYVCGRRKDPLCVERKARWEPFGIRGALTRRHASW